MVSLPNMMKRGVCMKNAGDTNKRYFPFYGHLSSISYFDYLSQLIDWVYEDDIGGFWIVRNEKSGEFCYVEGLEVGRNVSYL